MRATRNEILSSRLYRAGGLFALLFFMSGADGQTAVQTFFLLMTAGSLLLAECWSDLEALCRNRLEQARADWPQWMDRWLAGL